MQTNEFKELFKTQLLRLNIELNDNQYKSFYNYMNILLEWNNKINLTAITKPEDIIVKHFVDSLTVAKYVGDGEKVIDVGTGAGFPGIPLKIMKDNIQLTLLDAVNKKITFLNDVISKENLKMVYAIHGRAEDFGQDLKYRENFDVCTSRAVAPLNILLEYMLPFVKKGGICICMKGPEVDDEILQAEKALKILGGKIETIEKLSLSQDDNLRNIIVARKVDKTPKDYPRKAGTAKKTPL